MSNLKLINFKNDNNGLLHFTRYRTQVIDFFSNEIIVIKI